MIETLGSAVGRRKTTLYSGSKIRDGLVTVNERRPSWTALSGSEKKCFAVVVQLVSSEETEKKLQEDSSLSIDMMMINYSTVHCSLKRERKKKKEKKRRKEGCGNRQTGKSKFRLAWDFTVISFLDYYRQSPQLIHHNK